MTTTKPCKSSISHPLLVYTYSVDSDSTAPFLGISMLPGRTKQKVYFDWKRDLETDLMLLVNKYKVKNVVTLVTDMEIDKDIPIGQNYFEEIRKLNMNSIRFPITDKWIPSDMSEFTLLIMTIAQKVINKEMTLIHCNGGKGRSAMVLAAVMFILHTVNTNNNTETNIETNTNSNHNNNILHHSHPGTLSNMYEVINRIKAQCHGTLRNPMQIMYLYRFVYHWNWVISINNNTK